MLFCPRCSNMLEVSDKREGGVAFACMTCPFLFKVEKTMRYKEIGRTKKVDDVETQAAPTNITSDVFCPKCEHDQASYEEMQTRSADEPATLFFTCLKCSHKWKEG